MCGADGSVMTLRVFSIAMGSHCRWKIFNDQVRHRSSRPALRLRDARFMRRIRNGTVPTC